MTTDRSHVEDFAIYINTQECGPIKITHTLLESISNDQFSFRGSFYASGTFHSARTASGTTGLDHFEIPGCGVYTGGPWSWDATWQNSSQPSATSAGIEKLKESEPPTAIGEFYTVTAVK